MPQRTQRSYFRESTKVINANGTVTPGDRFLSTDEPTEETFKRLIESVTFVNEVEDRAKDSEQGLMKTTTGANVKSGNTPGDGFTYGAQIKNLPTLKTASQTIKDLSAVLVTATPDPATSGTPVDRNEYVMGLSTDFIQWLAAQLDTLTDAIANLNIPDISQLESDVSQLQTDVANAQSTADGAASSAASAQSTADGAATAAANAQSTADQNASDIAALGSNDGHVVGEMKFLPVNVSPGPEYFLADGQAISRTTYAALFLIYGTTFGAGDGATTFNLPNWSGRGFRGYNSANTADFGVGVAKGNDEVTIAAGNLPDHGHTLTNADVPIPLSDTAGTDATTVKKGNGTIDDTLNIEPTGTTDDAIGANNPIEIANPYLTVFVFIKAA